RFDQGAARGDGDVLDAVDFVGDRGGADATAKVVAPEHLAATVIEGVEVAVVVPGQDHPARGGEDAAVGGPRQGDAPADLPGRRVERRHHPGRRADLFGGAAEVVLAEP